MLLVTLPRYAICVSITYLYKKYYSCTLKAALYRNVQTQHWNKMLIILVLDSNRNGYPIKYRRSVIISMLEVMALSVSSTQFIPIRFYKCFIQTHWQAFFFLQRVFYFTESVLYDLFTSEGFSCETIKIHERKIENRAREITMNRSIYMFISSIGNIHLWMFLYTCLLCFLHRRWIQGVFGNLNRMDVPEVKSSGDNIWES